MPANPTALIPLVEGFEQVEALAVIDVLRRAKVAVTTAGHPGLEATSSHGVMVRADALLADMLARDWDAIILPGGPGTPRLAEAPGLLERLREQHASGRIVAAICAAPTVLAQAGLLEGVPATCFPGSRSGMKGAVLRDEPVVAHDNILTSQAMGTAVEFGLALAARLAGEDIAINVARSICYPPRSAFRREG